MQDIIREDIIRAYAGYHRHCTELLCYNSTIQCNTEAFVEQDNFYNTNAKLATAEEIKLISLCCQVCHFPVELSAS